MISGLSHFTVYFSLESFVFRSFFLLFHACPVTVHLLCLLFICLSHMGLRGSSFYVLLSFYV